MACREGLALASDLLLQKIRVASDCANAIRSIQEESMGQYGQITKEIRATSEQFLKAEFVHECRESNHDAHSLARSAIHNSLGCVSGSSIRLRAFVISTLLLISVEFPPKKSN